MRTIRKKIEKIAPAYPLQNLAPLSEILFIDIETTGFTAKSSIVYLIGCAYYDKDKWQIIQWFATSYEDEKKVIEAFFDFAKDFSCLIHFNGNNFDLPFISQKCAQHGLPYSFEHFQGIDLYKRTAPLRHFLHLPNCKQKTLEHFLDIYREDSFDGGQLIGMYHDYVKNQTDFTYNAIICHNADDLAGMFHILPILSYSDIFLQPAKVTKVQANYYRDLNGDKHQELYMMLSLPSELPKPISYLARGCYFKGEEKKASIKVPLYEEEMKYFYSNYKDYYYLPAEDIAMHKAVASFVDKSHREQAKASNCYTRKHSAYLPQWEILFEPFFKRDYKSNEYFFELTDEFKTDRTAFSSYASHILQMMMATV